jgi:hypothetical protein
VRHQLVSQPRERRRRYHPTRQEEGEPLASIGYITAVASDHPDKLYIGNSLAFLDHDCQDEGRPDNLCLRYTHENCVEPNLDNVPCYVEKHYCPMDDPDPSLCIVEASGETFSARPQTPTTLRFAFITLGISVS